MYSMLGHDLQSLTYIIAGSANGSRLMTSPTRRSAALWFWVARATNKSRSVSIPITRALGSITGREPQPVPHLLTRRSRVRSRRAGGHILRHNLPNLHGSTPFGGFRCPAGRLATFFEAEGNQKGSGSLKDPSLYRAPAPSSCALGAAPSRVLKSGARRS